MKRKAEFTQKALVELARYSWPGNIRELQNVIERILATIKGPKIDAETVVQLLEDQHEHDFQTQLQNDEVEEIKHALMLSRGKYSEAARVLGISRSTLWRKLKQLKI